MVPLLLGLSALLMLVIVLGIARRSGMALAWQAANQALMSPNLHWQPGHSGLSTGYAYRQSQSNLSAADQLVNNVQSGLFIDQLQTSLKTYH